MLPTEFPGYFKIRCGKGRQEWPGPTCHTKPQDSNGASRAFFASFLFLPGVLARLSQYVNGEASCSLSKDWIYNTRFALNSALLTVAAKSSVVVRGLRRWAIRRIPWLEWYACQQPLIWPVTSSDLSRPFWYIFTDLPWLLLYVSDMLLCLSVAVRSWFRWRLNAIVCYWGLCVNGLPQCK